MSDGFYRAFEEKHRGSREMIKARLRAYHPFVEPLLQIASGSKTIDLGCGRGEWLELMTELGFDAHGVDLDEGMLAACVERGLSVDKGDAIGFLAALPNDSQAIVSAFHFVEHISFEQLQCVVSEALRVLKPGGLLIMETPNPENIVVSTCNFYLDPSHQRPIPPQLLSFLPDYHGFARVKTVRLQESKSLTQSAAVTLQDVLGGVSPDYAVVAQKAAPAQSLQTLDPAFNDEYGLSLDTLAMRYTAGQEASMQQIEASMQQIEAKVWQAQEQAQQAATQAQQAEAKAWQAQVQAEQADSKAWQAQVQAEQADAKAWQAQVQAQQADARAGHAQAHASEFQQQLVAVMSSRSWRITGPLRWCGLQARLLRDQGLGARSRAFIKKLRRLFVRPGNAGAGAPPGPDNRAAAPSIHSPQSNPMPASGSRAEAPAQTGDISKLTPRARDICAGLEADIKNQRD